MSTLRDDVRAILRADWDGRSCGSIAAELGQDAERVRYSLRALKNRGEAAKDESGLWYLRQNGVVPEKVAVTRKMPDKDVAAVEDWVVLAQEDEPQAILELELAKHLDEQEALQRISMIPTDKLEQAPPVEQMVTLSLTVTSSLARQILALVP